MAKKTLTFGQSKPAASLGGNFGQSKPVASLGTKPKATNAFGAAMPQAGSPLMGAVSMLRDAPAAPAAPAANAGFDPLQDTTYLDTEARLRKARADTLSGVETAGKRDALDLKAAKDMLDETKGKTRTSTTRSANKQGLFYSGILGERLGDIDIDFGRRAAGLDTQFNDAEEARAKQTSEANSAFDSGIADAYKEALARYIEGAGNKPVDLPPETRFALNQADAKPVAAPSMAFNDAMRRQLQAWKGVKV